jgi:thiamine-phosphate pyrophosphorylase
MPILRYAITYRTHSGKSESAPFDSLLEQAGRLAADGIDFIQLREKDLAAQELIGLARGMVNVIRTAGTATRLLVNARADIALAAGAHGVHLPGGSEQLTPRQVRQLFQAAGRPQPTISVSCHTLADVYRAHADGAGLILFGPVFEKSVDGRVVVPGTGLDALRAACAAAGETPVLALGGVTEANTAACIDAGASGVAAIRLFL